MSQHKYFNYSITIHSDDLALITSMRALAWFCQNEINRQIAVAGAKEEDWDREGHKVTFFFTSEHNRTVFLDESKRLFRPEWKISSQSNSILPKPQR